MIGREDAGLGQGGRGGGKSGGAVMLICYGLNHC